MSELLVGLALVFVLEGIVLFAVPANLRKMMLQMAGLNDGKLRFAGLTSMIVGLAMLYLVH